MGGNFLFDVFGLAFFHHQHAAFVQTEIGDLIGHQRRRDVEHQQWNARVAKGIGQTKLLQGANQGVVEAALHDDAHIAVFTLKVFVQPVGFDVSTCSRNALGVFEFFVLKRDGRMRQTVVVKLARFGHRVQGRHCGRLVVFGHKTATHMAGANAQLHQRGHVGHF